MSRLGWALNLDTAPTEEPVSLSEAKTHCRVDVGDDDAYITALITVARDQAEKITRRALITQTWDLVLDKFPPSTHAISIPFAPLASVTSIIYADSNGDSQTWSSSLYTVDSSNEPGAVVPAYGQYYPATRSHINSITVKFIAGYGDATAVPKAIKQAILMMIGHFYERRETTIIGAPVLEVPQTAEYLLWPYRVLEFQ